MDIETINKRLRGLRAENEYSLKYVCLNLKGKGINIHRETLRRYETGKCVIPLDVFMELLKIYNTDPFIFFKEVCEKNRNM